MSNQAPQPSRRSFLHHTAAATAALAATPHVFSVASSPSEKINVACMGVRGRGDGVMRTFADQKDVILTHICDVDTNVLKTRAGNMKQKTGRDIKTTTRYEDILEDKDVDALVVTTPDHWHAIPTIAACKAGKDVYVEKPDGHNILEGKMMVAAARKYKRIVQMGTQARSAPYLREATELVQSGAIGKVLYGKAWESARQGAIPKKPDTDPPPYVDYDRWLGPAPQRKFNRYRYHGNWRWFFDYGCGDLGNDGVHRIDYCLAMMGITELPRRVQCMGGKLFFDDAQDWPDTMINAWEFGKNATGGANAKPDAIITYEMRIWSRPRLHGETEAGAVFGEKGYVICSNSGYRAYDAGGKVFKESRVGNAHTLHIRNFLDAVKSRKRESLNQEIASGHIASVMCHSGNIAWRTGKTLTIDPKTEMFDDKEANVFVSREYRKGFELPSIDV